MQQLRTGAFTRTTLWILASPIILLMLTGFLTESTEARQRNNVAYASVTTLRSQLAGAKGFKVETMRVTDAGAACIQYRILDAGGRLKRGQAVVVDKEITQDGRHGDRFEKAWNRQCLGPAYDVTDAVDHFF
ncbi:MAG TPA: hypothetical protein VFS13_05905 [Steroidobacteraceae bacterium]|jgi:hypothetical protein|nr:hypothetical protein [Steroidobacteraceae bacterium]